VPTKKPKIARNRKGGDKIRIQLRLSPKMKENIDGVGEMVGLESTQESIVFLLAKALEIQIMSKNSSRSADTAEQMLGIFKQVVEKEEDE